MATIRKCDHCGMDITEANPVVAKLFTAPVSPGMTRSTHSHYSAHMDIGKCCASWVPTIGKWQKRKSRKEYNFGRKLHPTDTLASSEAGKASKASAAK